MPEMACIRDRERGGKKKQQIWLISAAERSVGRSRSPPICPVPHPIAPATYQNIDSALPSWRCIQTKTQIEASMTHPGGDCTNSATGQQGSWGRRCTGQGGVPKIRYVEPLLYNILQGLPHTKSNHLLNDWISLLDNLFISLLECRICQKNFKSASQ